MGCLTMLVDASTISKCTLAFLLEQVYVELDDALLSLFQPLLKLVQAAFRTSGPFVGPVTPLCQDASDSLLSDETLKAALHHPRFPSSVNRPLSKAIDNYSAPVVSRIFVSNGTL